MKRLVVLTGAGISAESGIRTFRDMGGLWEEYDVMEVASPEAWERNPELVTRFYNDRRKQLLDTKPNNGHVALAKAEEYLDVSIVTQNVDDLHERAGSSKILHLHGELKKARSTGDSSYIVDVKGWELKLSDKCPKGYQLRPHIVWFGEEVPAISEAIQIVKTANFLAVVGTSLNVYPAAGLIDYAPRNAKIFLVDPNEVNVSAFSNVMVIKKPASIGVPEMLKLIKEIVLSGA